jgi:triphosphoribosyl-dephospho-CoA synthase
MTLAMNIAIDSREHSEMQSLDAVQLGAIAAWALREEALLTPKPGLVDRRGAGAHTDMDLAMLLRSTDALEPYFVRIADCAATMPFGVALRSQLGAIGREAEIAMLATTGGVNTHRGAIWALGLLISGSASLIANPVSRARSRVIPTVADSPQDARAICDRAARIARLPIIAEATMSHGSAMHARYGTRGARGEAQCGFFHVREVALPALRTARERYGDEQAARQHALLALIAGLDDTCLLYRGGGEALAFAQNGSQRVLGFGLDDEMGKSALHELDRGLIKRNASPGGSADLLAAALMLDRIEALTETNDGNA